MIKKNMLSIIFLLVAVFLFSFCSSGSNNDGSSTSDNNDDALIDNNSSEDYTEDTTQGKTFYLDAQLTGSCAGTYSILNRDCSGSDGDAYDTLQAAMAELSGGDTLIIRAGTYSRIGFDPLNPHEIGALDIGWNNACNGTASDYTVVKAYTGEQPVILTEPGIDHYNPDPSDISFTNSSRYYNNPAIGIHGDYIAVSGLKTFGMVVITWATHSIVEKCDLGGGGPRNDQGNFIAIDYEAHDITIKNNKIHDSCWGENDENGAAVIVYNAHAIIENNEFYDNWGADVYIKDSRGQQGRTMSVKYNFFGPSTIDPDCKGYICHNQGIEVDSVLIHHNIFLEKASGIQWGTIDADMPVFPYSNTFVNCTEFGLHAWAVSHDLISYNNLFYNANGTPYFLAAYTIEETDYNLFYSAVSGNAAWSIEGSSYYETSSLTEWQNHSHQDLHSVDKDPLFINAAGNSPEDFKRQDYSGDVSGSTYGTVCGAYQTGSETIGLIDW